LTRRSSSFAPVTTPRSHSNSLNHWRRHNAVHFNHRARRRRCRNAHWTGSGTVTNFNCAVDQGWGDAKQTNWYRVAIWGERGSKLAQYIKKGEKVAVTGELVIGEYNGKPQYEIRCADVDCFMSGKQAADTPAQRQPAHADLDDDAPF
jgi:single-strand DNA-binding protein